MPDQWERHSRSRWEWGNPSSRQQQRQRAAQDDPVHDKVPGKKDPHRCKSSKDGYHNIILVDDIRRYYGSGCGWAVAWNSKENKYAPGYSCSHSLRCEHCGKRYGRAGMKRCPKYTDEVPQRVLDECVQYMEKREARLIKWKPHRQVIKGPTHYRKKKKI